MNCKVTFVPAYKKLMVINIAWKGKGGMYVAKGEKSQDFEIFIIWVKDGNYFVVIFKNPLKLINMKSNFKN